MTHSHLKMPQIGKRFLMAGPACEIMILTNFPNLTRIGY
jgi:hypothetical protein